MTAPRLLTQLLLRPEDLPPSRPDFEVVGAFNPGAVQAGDEVVLLVRVAERPREPRPGFTGLPRWDRTAGLTVDWVRDEELLPIDPRVVMSKASGRVRLTFISHLRVVRCGAGRTVREITDITFRPETELEEFGVEDPRITPLNGRYYFTYVSVSRHGPATALASTVDFRSFERHGIIFCPENKDVVLFPEPIDGSFAALHRPVCGTPFTRPEVWVARSSDLMRWGAHAPSPSTNPAQPMARSGRPAGSEPGLRRSGFRMAGLRSITAIVSPRSPAKWGLTSRGPAPRSGRSYQGPRSRLGSLLRPRGRLRNRRVRPERRVPDRPGPGSEPGPRDNPRLLRRRRCVHGGCRVRGA